MNKRDYFELMISDQAVHGADPELYTKFERAIGIGWRNENFWHRVDLIDRNGVIYAYRDERLVFSELEDRFPTEMNVARFKLVSL